MNDNIQVQIFEKNASLVINNKSQHQIKELIISQMIN